MKRLAVILYFGFLITSTGLAYGQCQASQTALCLNEDRFSVEVQWRTADGMSGTGQARGLTGDTGYFWFFDQDNVEMIVKVLDACGFNDRFWVFAAGLTNVEASMRVTDTFTGETSTYSNPLGTPFQPIQDTDAFATCPQPLVAGPDSSAAAAPDTPLAVTSAPALEKVVCGDGVCLNGERFRVTADWRTADGNSGRAKPVSLTDDTGYFWFFSPGNVEAVVKIIDGCGFNDRFWVFAAGLTNVEVQLRVEDTETGAVATYTNPLGTAFEPIQDTFAFATCEDDGGGMTVPPSVLIDSSRPSGMVGTTFDFRGSSFAGPGIVDWSWQLGDGRTASGPSVSVAYTTPGIYLVELVATTATGETTEASLAVSVLEANGAPASALGLSNRLADVDGSGSVELLDALLAAQAASGLSTLDREADRQAADLDFDSTLGLQDVRLLGQAVLSGTGWPRHLEPTSGPPGRVVRIYSPSLRDPAGLIEIEVGNSLLRQEPVSLVPGYATIFVPLDPTSGGSSQVTPGPLEIRLLRDGQVVDIFSFQLEAAPALPADPRQELKSFFDDYLTLLGSGEAAVGEVLDQIGVAGTDREVILGLHRSTEVEMRNAVNEWRALLDTPQGDALAALFFRFVGVNGFDDFQSQLARYLERRAADGDGSDGSAKIFTPQEVCSLAVPALCDLQEQAALIARGEDQISLFCDLLLIGGLVAIVYPGDGPVLDIATLSLWVARCGAVEAALGIGSLVRDYVGGLLPRVLFEASTQQPQGNEVVTLSGDLQVLGIREVCDLALLGGGDAIRKKLTERVVAKILRSKLTLQAIKELIELLSDSLLEDFQELLGDVVGVSVEESGIVAAFEQFADQFCSQWNSGEPAPFALEGTLTGPTPDIGDLFFRSDGRAEFRCPTGPGAQSGTVEFTVAKAVCDGDDSGRVLISCGGSSVTITMGDNGSLLDDIFEVRLEGQTVLTSSVPVRNVSTTLDLLPGDYTVTMLGRAAPDGIGTYFISFTGVTVTGGDALSGSDLTPGVVKTFFINVP